MADNALRALLRDSEGRHFRFTFADGAELLAELVSASHVDADATVVVLRVGAAADECGWQVPLSDICSVATPDGHCLYARAEPGPAADRPRE
jgi:hypothetical protein